MGWFVVPDTADPELVCREPCDHPVCAKLRKFDTRTCRICGQGFEAGQRFYFQDDEAVHAVCADDRRSEILELRGSGLSCGQIASRVGLSQQRVWRIVNPRRRRSSQRPKAEYPVLLSTGKVARMLGVHTNTVRRWDNEGILRSWRVGPKGDRRFRRDEIEETMPQPRRRPAPTGIQKGDPVIPMKGGDTSGTRVGSRT